MAKQETGQSIYPENKDTQTLSNDFLQFVHQMQGQLDLPYGADTAAHVSVPENYSELPPQEFLHHIWNQRASEWLSIERDPAYYTTMETLLTYMKLHPGGNEQILSVGSGPGVYECYLASLMEQALGSKAPTITVTDFSEEMIQIQQNIRQVMEEQQERKIRNMKMEVQDMTKLKAKTKTVNHLICNNSLQWVPDWQQAIREFARVITPVRSGYLYLFLNENPLTSIQTTEGETVLEMTPPTPDEVIQSLEQSKFQILAVRILNSSEGQGSGSLHRRFIHAQYTLKPIKPWNIANSKSSFYLGKRK